MKSKSIVMSSHAKRKRNFPLMLAIVWCEWYHGYRQYQSSSDVAFTFEFDCCE